MLSPVILSTTVKADPLVVPGASLTGVDGEESAHDIQRSESVRKRQVLLTAVSMQTLPGVGQDWQGGEGEGGGGCGGGRVGNNSLGLFASCTNFV